MTPSRTTTLPTPTTTILTPTTTLPTPTTSAGSTTPAVVTTTTTTKGQPTSPKEMTKATTPLIFTGETTKIETTPEETTPEETTPEEMTTTRPISGPTSTGVPTVTTTLAPGTSTMTPSRTTTLPTPTTSAGSTTSVCYDFCTWTDWIDDDFDVIDSGTEFPPGVPEYEFIPDYCDRVIGIDCVTVEDGTDFSFTSNEVTCNMANGLQCIPANGQDSCNNFKMRVLCCFTQCQTTSHTTLSTPLTTTEVERTTSLPTPSAPVTSKEMETTTAPSCYERVCRWSDWFNDEDGQGKLPPNMLTDDESVNDLCKSLGYPKRVCKNREDIECRTTDDIPFTDLIEKGRDVKCRLKKGLSCKVKRKFKKTCPDFKIRVLFCAWERKKIKGCETTPVTEHTTMSYIGSTPPTTTVETTAEETTTEETTSLASPEKISPPTEETPPPKEISEIPTTSPQELSTAKETTSVTSPTTTVTTTTSTQTPPLSTTLEVLPTTTLKTTTIGVPPTPSITPTSPTATTKPATTAEETTKSGTLSPTPVITTPSCLRKVCEWSDWYNDEVETGESITWEDGGEFEMIEDFLSEDDTCDNPDDMQCRDAFTLLSSDLTGQNVICDTENGLICTHNDNASLCNDYEIRMLCCHYETIEECLTPIPETTPEVTTPEETTPEETTPEETTPGKTTLEKTTTVETTEEETTPVETTRVTPTTRTTEAPVTTSLTTKQPEECQATPVGAAENIQYDNCTSNTAVVVYSCQGRCASSTTFLGYSNGEPMFESQCTCCRPLEYVTPLLEFTCDNGSVISREIKIISQCTCEEACPSN